MADRATCANCDRGFVYRPETVGAPPPSSCGRLLCRAAIDWTPEDWAGKRRMTSARQQAGVPLTELDTLALQRSPNG